MIVASGIAMQFGASPFFGCLREVRRGKSLWADRRERLRQVDVHEDFWAAMREGDAI